MKTLLALLLTTTCVLAAPIRHWPMDEQDSEGPRAPEYPGFAKNNTALKVSTRNIPVFSGDDPAVQFKQGDTITLEAWIQLDGINDDQNMYIVGKGRTHNEGLPQNNQNYALRLRGQNGGGSISFLFRSAGVDGAWHRWTSHAGITPGPTWHHVSATYTFGQPASIQGSIDGVAVEGAWDMGGATPRAPVVDDDEIWIGSAMARSPGNTFRGSIDEVKIHRGLLDQAALAKQLKRVIPPAPPPPEIPGGNVLVELFEQGVKSKVWNNRLSHPAETYTESAFGFFRHPFKYISTGIREDRPSPFLIRAMANITLPAGKHELLVRSRAGARVFMGTRQLISLPFRGGSQDGHNPIRTDYLDLGPGVRFAQPGGTERALTFETDGSEQTFRIEFFVGGLSGKSKFRNDIGETTVSVRLAGEEQFKLLSPAKRYPYTDEGWQDFVDERSPLYDELDARHRKQAFASQQVYWQERHEQAKAWVTQQSPAAHRNIDGFIDARLDKHAKAHGELPENAQRFVSQVQPLLKEHCWRCHGEKEKGGLRLDQRSAAITGGESEHPALVPGKPGKSQMLELVRSSDEDKRMPPKGEGLSEAEINTLSAWIKDGAHWPEGNLGQPVQPTRMTKDSEFLRRVYLDTVGVPPSEAEIERFMRDPKQVRREFVIDQLLQDPRRADHWVSYWQDVLAENPNLVKPSLNNSGPFRWWIYESFRDNKPMDVFVSELLEMTGSTHNGGTAGFALASQNDVPMAAKATIVAGAFLGVETKCARCHDAPYHEVKQEQLFQLAAMMQGSGIKVPHSSSVPMDTLHQEARKPLIEVTLKAGSTVQPAWPFPAFAQAGEQSLAEILTAPENERFAQVLVNRMWRRYFGRGLVESAHDWEGAIPSHPELLRWLGHQFVASGYDYQALARLILNSTAYQRSTTDDPAAQARFAGPTPRRMQAEQIVDTLFSTTGLRMDTEEITMDQDLTNKRENFINLGKPRRGWMFTSLSNERDRPSLALPRAQAVIDVLSAFGWRPSRQEPLTDRGNETNVIQPAIIANGTMGSWITRLSDQHALTELCLEEQPVEDLVDRVFLRLYTRYPEDDEKALYVKLLRPGYDQRVVSGAGTYRPPHQSPRYLSWSNHLRPAANELALVKEREALNAYPPTQRLNANWRDRMEDMVWALVNRPEMVYVP